MSDEGTPAQAYSAGIARIYDQVFPSFSSSLAPRLHDLYVKRFGVSGRGVLDLCCGTAKVARYFSARGIRAIGIDASEGMLEGARAGGADATTAGSLEFAVGDARDFKLVAPVDLCACTYTAMNHMRSMAELQRCCTSVLRNLSANGLFVFDLLTLKTLETFNGETVVDRADGFQLWRYLVNHDEQRSYNEVIGFTKNEDATFSRYRQSYVLSMFALKDVCTMLLATGWKRADIMRFDALESAVPEPEHNVTVMIVAEAGAKTDEVAGSY
jgi:ubiquinone/menaquinone biosynthesis C-methylase UbiE